MPYQCPYGSADDHACYDTERDGHNLRTVTDGVERERAHQRTAEHRQHQRAGLPSATSASMMLIEETAAMWTCRH
jgi:hypothetical protein